MAIQQLGVQMVVRGAEKMARDLSHVALSMYNYSKAVNTAEKSMMRMSSSAARQTESAMSRQQKVVDRLTEAYWRQARAVSRLIDAGVAGDKLASAYNRLNDIWDDLGSAQTELAKATEANTKAQADLNDMLNQSGSIVQTLSKFFSVLTGKFGEGIVGATRLDTALLKIGLQGAAVGLALNTVTLALDAIAIVAKIVMGGLNLIFGVFTKLVSAAVNLGKSIVGFVVKGLKELIKLPFNLVIKGLTGIWNSIKRIGEIAIGMNISNLIWNLGTKLKDTAIMAVEAAADFQLMQIRLRGLVQRELVEASDGSVSFADAMGQATERAKELSYWVSELAVKSIFGAEDINNTLTLAMAYDFTSKEAQDLTEAIVNFSTGMGLTDEQMRRIIENFGQMKAAGKAAGTELRDLARGSFVPVNKIFEMMGERLGITGKNIAEVREEIQRKISEGDIPINEFFKEFINMSKTQFPDAIESASASFKTVTSNIQDFIKSFVGWRIITPTLDIISKRMSDFMQMFMTEDMRAVAEMIGSGIAFVADAIFKMQDALSPGFLQNLNAYVAAFRAMLDMLKKVVNGEIKSSQAFMSIMAILKRMGIEGKNITRFVNRIFDLVRALRAIKDMKNPAEGIKGVIDSVKGVLGSLWNDILVPEIKKIWEEKLLPKLQELWGFISGFVKDLWENKIPAWWEETGKPALLNLINSLITWVTESDDAKGIGEKIADGIANGIEAAKDSGILQRITETLKGMLAAAATVAMEVLTGILSGGGDSNQPNIEAIQGQRGQPGAGASGATQQFSELASAVERLNTAARDRARDALVEFLQALDEKAPGLTTVLKIMIGFAGAIELIGRVAAQFADPIAKLFDAFGRIFGASGGKPITPGAGGPMDQLRGIADAVGQLAALPLKMVADWFDSVATLFQILDQSGVVGLFQALMVEISNLTNINLEDVKSFFVGFASFLIAFAPTIFQPLLDAASSSSDDIRATYQNLSDILVGHSIIPDMLTMIEEVFIMGWERILSYTQENFASPLAATFTQMDLYAAGEHIVQSLWDGLAAGVPALLSWWEGIKAQFHITVTVGWSYGTPPGTPGTPVDPKGKTDPKDKGPNPKDKEVPKLKKGGNFIVPTGYPNDQFPILLSSGEQVIVIPNAKNTMKNRGQASPTFLNQNIMNTGGPTFNNTRETNLNLNVTTSKPLSTVEREFNNMRFFED